MVDFEKLMREARAKRGEAEVESDPKWVDDADPASAAAEVVGRSLSLPPPSPPPPPPPPPPLSDEQKVVVAALDAGRNIFLTGVGGTGKTYCLGAWLAALAGKKRVAVTASTGIAALNLGGQTIHSWTGFGIGEKKVEELVMSIRWQDYAAPRMREADVLVLDEVSMISARHLNAFDMLCRHARCCEESFGGLQVVLVGDFGQLPPVSKGDAPPEKFAFRAAAWRGANLEVHELREVRRQSEAGFVRALTEARDGKLAPDSLKLFESRVRAYDPDAAPEPVRVFTHNRQVDEMNERRLAALTGSAVAFQAQEFGHESLLARIDKDCLSPRVLSLKVGARVMFTRNDQAGRFCNGTLGTVRSMVESGFFKQEQVVVGLDDGREVYLKERAAWEIKDGDRVVASRKQLPLKLAWAATVHKTQGQTIDRISVDLSRVFEHGQGYVAVSRARSAAGLNIEAWRGAATFSAHPEVTAWAERRRARV